MLDFVVGIARMDISDLSATERRRPVGAAGFAIQVQVSQLLRSDLLL
jgi:hypothetical protein